MFSEGGNEAKHLKVCRHLLIKNTLSTHRGLWAFAQAETSAWNAISLLLLHLVTQADSFITF